MAMVVGAQQALHSTASLRSSFQSSSRSSSSSSSSAACSDSSPSSVPISRPLASSRAAGLGVSWTPRELSSAGVGAISQGSSNLGSSDRWQHGRKRRGCLLGCRASFGGGGGALTPELKSALDNFVQSNKVVLFMKGNRNFPQCGFSNTCIQILNQCQVPYETVNILEDDSLRQGVKEYSSWPTYPQLYIDGEFFGGCDIALESFQSGELQEVLDKALVS